MSRAQVGLWQVRRADLGLVVAPVDIVVLLLPVASVPSIGRESSQQATGRRGRALCASSDRPWSLQGAIDFWQEEETADGTAKISGSWTNIKRTGPSSLGSSRMGEPVVVGLHPAYEKG